MIWLARPFAVMGLLFAGTAYLGQHVMIQHRLAWLAAVAATLVLSFAIALGLGLPASLRAAVVERMVLMTHRLSGGRA